MMSWFSTLKSCGELMNYISQGLMAINDRCARLEWKAINDLNHSHFNVYCQEGMSASTELIEKNVKTNEYITAPLRYDVDYNFYITSVNMSGVESILSAPIYFKLEEATTIQPQITYYKKKNVTLSSTPFVIDLTNMTKNTKISFEVI